jgi:hypothetical protein
MMTEEQIDKVFELMSKSKPTARENIKTLYLERLGESIIDYCLRHFKEEENADVRSDYLGFMLQYSKTEGRVTEFAKIALTDKSKKVRKKALSILAFSLKADLLDFLGSQRGILKGNEEDIENAIIAIKNQNHNLFYPACDRWTITPADKNRHFNKAQFAEDVKLYIEKYAKETVSELKNILGSLHC